MWISFVVGWILGSASLYAYMLVTAKEPEYEVCMRCSELQCDGCHTVDTGIDLERAA